MISISLFAPYTLQFCKLAIFKNFDQIFVIINVQILSRFFIFLISTMFQKKPFNGYGIFPSGFGFCYPLMAPPPHTKSPALIFLSFFLWTGPFPSKHSTRRGKNVQTHLITMIRY